MDRNIKENTGGQASKIQSPYPALQALLPRLAALSPMRTSRPVFRQRDEADAFIRNHAEEADYILTPMWTLDHTDLTSSKILGWSVTQYPV